MPKYTAVGSVVGVVDIGIRAESELAKLWTIISLEKILLRLEAVYS